ncbi:hypothetical protein SLNWT_7022 [Streptomyces albus]|uniref:Uncharacterized protein n=1 Tax=Streptomyces albus (strain ATCC 21838 / DSM 41398 / FERM P-419 / JCM 4703 / NBRC 107858) TaxID=1081613 RepID=A0A0B5EX67_STRA4|nr:hypothetical protein SLNWT_7022 [Streptomyces albus]AOU81701.1 hypothetical protein SLNHY_7010 [Streptomyces albus]
MPSDYPTAHDLACALAEQLCPGAAPRDVTVSFGARQQAKARYGHRGRGGSVALFAQSLHAHLFGLPLGGEALPSALDALYQYTVIANAPEQKTAIVQQIAEQLRNATAILQSYYYEANMDRLPAEVAAQLLDAHDKVEQVAATLDAVAPALSSPPAPPPARRRPRPAAADPSKAAPAAQTPPAAHRR